MRWKITALSLAILVLAALAGFSWFNWFGDEPVIEEKGEPVTATRSTDHKEARDDDGQNKDKEPVEGVINASRDWTESSIMRTLHEMTHQKVKANEKWGAVAMTKENIQKMIKVVQDHKKDLDHYDVYIEMLNEWKLGDFSQADKHHNKIWRLQNGNIGKARGLLSEEQEQEYIEAHFDDDVGTFKW